MPSTEAAVRSSVLVRVYDHAAEAAALSSQGQRPRLNSRARPHTISLPVVEPYRRSVVVGDLAAPARLILI